MLKSVGVKPPIGMVLKVTVKALNTSIPAMRSMTNSEIVRPR